MSHRRLIASALAVTLGAAAGGSRTAALPPGEAAQAAAGQSPEPATSTAGDQVDLQVTVYNADLALVRDTRTVRLDAGVHDLHFTDIAATVNPASVHFRSVTDPSRVSVLEQNYECDLLGPDTLLHKYVGRDVTLVRRQPGQGTTEEPVTARLLSYNGAPVWRIDGQIVTGLQTDHMRFPELPGNLYSHPTLIWTLDNRSGTQQRIEASYLASRIGWSADYVLTVARDDRSADLDGWVTIDNRSGSAFRRAALQLVAGNLHLVRPVLEKAAYDAAALRAEAPPAAPMTREPFSDYHLYTLPRRTSINDHETKQVSMLNATGFPVRKRYVVEGRPFYFRTAQPGAAVTDQVQVFYQIDNGAGSGLGMPMPSGMIRVYQSDSRGGLQFVGEDRIEHTPVDETLNLRIGSAFDVTSERTQVDFERIASNTIEFEYEITLKNHKTVPVSIEVNEPIGGSWRMLRSNYDATRAAAFAARFTVPVAAAATSVLRYRVRVTS